MGKTVDFGPGQPVGGDGRAGGLSRRLSGEVVVVDLDWRSVAAGLFALVALVGITVLIRSVPRTATWCTIGMLLALALNPLVGGVERRLRVRRGFAVATVLAGFLVAVALLVLLLGPPTARQVRDLQDDIPGVVDELGELPFVGDDLVRNDVPQKVEDFLSDLPSRLAGDTAPIENAARSILGGAIAGLATVLVTVALLLDGERVVRAVRRVVPRRHRDRADRVGSLFYEVVGRYFAGSLLVAGIAGLSVLMVGLILGVPLTPVLAMWVAVFDLVPQIGGAAGGVPFVLMAFTQGAGTGLIAAVFFVLYLQFENNLLAPLVVGDAVDLSPPATMVAALVGVSAAGVPGALVAVPLLGVTKAVYAEFRPTPRSTSRGTSGRTPHANRRPEVRDAETGDAGMPARPTEARRRDRRTRLSRRRRRR
ncbi:AI-2E family transporter [soil metagenome]